MDMTSKFWRDFWRQIAHTRSIEIWSKLIVLKMFDPDAAVAAALVLALHSKPIAVNVKSSHLRLKFWSNFWQEPTHASKYWRLVKKYQTDLIHQIFYQCFLTKKNLPHTVKYLVKNLTSNFCFKFWRFIWSCVGPLTHLMSLAMSSKIVCTLPASVVQYDFFVI